MSGATKRAMASQSYIYQGMQGQLQITLPWTVHGVHGNGVTRQNIERGRGSQSGACVLGSRSGQNRHRGRSRGMRCKRLAKKRELIVNGAFEIITDVDVEMTDGVGAHERFRPGTFCCCVGSAGRCHAVVVADLNQYGAG